MKHAYLIIAHNEFDILKLLVESIDDSRNDIYIHFDKKVKRLPQISTKNAGLFILENRIDVRWADFSMVEAELNLFEKAWHNHKYSYYHLISGVDLPIKSQDYIHQFFEQNRGKEFIGYHQSEIETELNRRARRYHLFTSSFRETKGFINLTKRLIRYLYIKVQPVIGITRNDNLILKKGTQWVSISHQFVEYLLSQKQWIRKTFNRTFCSDELVVQTLCWNSKFRQHIYNPSDEGLGCMRHIKWINGEILNFENSDWNTIDNSPALFARKFTHSTKDLLLLIKENKWNA